MAARQSRTQNRGKRTKGSLSAPGYTKSGTRGKAIPLPKEIFGQEPNETLLAQAVRVYLSNQRKARAKTLRRGEVRKSTRKIWRQKGTGRARHGAASAPIFVGGGIAHGPRGIENYQKKLPAKMRKKALVSALSAKQEAGELLIADLERIEPKTKNVAGLLKKIDAAQATIVQGGSDNLWRAARNIEGINLIPALQLTAYDVLTANKLVFTKEGLSALEKRLKGGKNEAV